MDHLAPALTAVMTALGSAALKATALLAMASLLARLLRRRAAALRHLMWTVALGSIVAVLVLPIVLPAWRVVPIPVVTLNVVGARAASTTSRSQERRAAPATRRDVVDDVSASRPLRSQNTSNTRTGVNAQGFGGVSWPAMIVGLWLLGVLVVAYRHVSSRVALMRLARSSTPLPESGALAGQIARQMRIARPVCLRTSDEVELPFTWGIFRPQIVLPGDASEWTLDCRRHVLQHELAHVQRVDAGTQLVAQAASALFWFHPLVWYAVGQMRCERERACDDHVLASGAVACDYASDLLALVTSYGYVERHAVALAFARRSHFEGRLLALLDPTIERGSLSPSRMATVLSLSAAFVIPLATLERAEARTVTRPPVIVSAPVVQNAQTVASRPTPPVSLPVARTASIPVAVEKLEPDVVVQSTQSAVDDIFAACTVRSWNHQSDHSSSGDGNITVWTASGQSDDCAFDLKSEGDIVFNGDATAIDHMTPGAHLDVTTSIRGDVSQLAIRSSADGALSYNFTRNGQRADFAVGGAAWLKQVLIGLDRTTGFAIDIRFPVLLQAGGSESVLSDVALMRADRARFLYVRRLIEAAAPLDVRAIRQVGDVVASMRFGHDAAELIVGVASQYPLVDAVARLSFLKAALSMEGDHDQARALLSIISGATLTGEETAAVLGSLRRMTTDQQKSRVLLTLASTQRLDGDLRNAYAAAAESIRDPQLRARTLGLLPVR